VLSRRGTLGDVDDSGEQHEQRYQAVLSRDVRFDGWFVTAVHTTGIYCRPSCPAITPKRRNVSFFPTAAAAQQQGFRACKRCRPDASPGSPEWNVRTDVVARSMRLIADGVIDRDGVAGLAHRLGYSERHLNRLVSAELGAGPLAIARARRAQTARLLIETTTLSMTEIAFAAGFTSVRQFNDTVREVFALSPSDLRAGKRAGTVTGTVPTGAAIPLRLAVRQPFHAPSLFGFLATRSVPGVEHGDIDTYTRAMRLPHGAGVVTLTAPTAAEPTTVGCTLWLEAVADLQAAVQRCRRLLDLDADPVAVDAHLAADPLLAPLVAQRAGLRSPGAVDGGELLVRAIIGQQVSVAGARTVTARLVERWGEPLVVPTSGVAGLHRLFPSAHTLATIDPSELPMPAARARSLIHACAAVADGSLTIDAGVDRAELAEQLVAIPGIGPWTTQYVAMRALGDPDVFMPTDVGVRNALRALGTATTRPNELVERSRTWSPWRSYAQHHLWCSLTPPRRNPT